MAQFCSPEVKRRFFVVDEKKKRIYKSIASSLVKLSEVKNGNETLQSYSHGC